MYKRQYLFSDGGGLRRGREPMRLKDGTVMRDRNGNVMYHIVMDRPDPGGVGGLTYAPDDIRGKMLADRDKMMIRRYEDEMAADKKISDSMGTATVKSGKRRLFGFGPDRIDAAIAKSLGLFEYGGPVEKFFTGGLSAAVSSVSASVSGAVEGAAKSASDFVSGTSNFDFLDPDSYRDAADSAVNTAVNLGKQIQDKVGIDVAKIDFRNLDPSDFGAIEGIVGKDALQFIISITEYDYVEGFEQAWSIIEYLYNELLPKLEFSLGVDLGNYKSPIGTSGRGIFYGLGGLISTMGMGGLVYGPSHADGGIIAEMEGGEYVMNKNSVSDVGLGIMNGINNEGGSFIDKLVSNSFEGLVSGGAGFAMGMSKNKYIEGFSSGFSSDNTMSLVSTLTEKSSMNNQLLSRLIEVVEEKELSVTVVNDERDTGGGRDIRMSREREMSYRGARNIA